MTVVMKGVETNSSEWCLDSVGSPALYSKSKFKFSRRPWGLTVLCLTYCIHASQKQNGKESQ